MLFTLFINIHMINSTKNQIVNLEEINEIEDIDAIIVLGCRIHENSIPSLMLANRLERGIDVYDKLKIPIILFQQIILLFQFMHSVQQEIILM